MHKVNKQLLVIVTLAISTVLLSSYKGLKISNDFYNDKVVGVIINVDSICISYDESHANFKTEIKESNPKIENYWLQYLKKYENEIAFKEQITKNICNFLDEHNKKYIILNETVNYTNFPMFKGRIKQTGGKKKRACQYDFRSLKNKYNLDNVLVINANYGMVYLQYNSYIKTFNAYNSMASVVVDLNDNSLEMVEQLISPEKIHLSIKFPEDENEFLKSLQKTIDHSIDDLREQLTPDK